MELNKIYNGDNETLLDELPDNSIDSLVTDPPYGINFMNKKWDYDVPKVELWQKVLRVLKPGAYGLVACGTRTQHRMAVNLEDAGFEIRDIVAWVYGSGFPKSMNISKAIESFEKYGKSNTIALKETEQDGDGEPYQLNGKNNGIMGEPKLYNRKEYSPSTDQAKQYQGWGTALKPAMELWTLVRKPLEEPTVAENVLKWGTGGINVDGCRVAFEGNEEVWSHGDLGAFENVADGYQRKNKSMFVNKGEASGNNLGRFPANFIHDGSEEVVKLFPNEEGQSPSRFFYTAKASQSERNNGLWMMESEYPAAAEFRPNQMEKALNGESGNPFGRWQPKKNIHPTIKPISLMRYLCRMVTPKGGTVLDPYAGSGSTLIAAKMEKFDFIGFELDKKYVEIAQARIKATNVQYNIFDYDE